MLTNAKAEERQIMIQITSDTPSPKIEIFSEFIQSGLTGPVVMLNLLQFRTEAQYEDGRETDLSGVDAYQIYAKKMKTLVEEAGGRYIYVGRPVAALIGESDNWDMIALVEYPSVTKFAEITTTAEYQAISVHRKAGLRAQVLTATHDASTFAMP